MSDIHAGLNRMALAIGILVMGEHRNICGTIENQADILTGVSGSSS